MGKLTDFSILVLWDHFLQKSVRASRAFTFLSLLYYLLIPILKSYTLINFRLCRCGFGVYFNIKIWKKVGMVVFFTTKINGSIIAMQHWDPQHYYLWGGSKFYSNSNEQKWTLDWGSKDGHLTLPPKNPHTDIQLKIFWDKATK